MTDAPTISTHVLDVESGRPAAGVTIELYRTWDETRVGFGVTDQDGRIRRLAEGPLEATETSCASPCPDHFSSAPRSPFMWTIRCAAITSRC